MFKFITFMIVILAVGALSLMAAGYRFQPENLQYYTKLEGGGTQHEVTLTNGTVLSGVIESETEQSIRLNMEGAITDFSKGEIKSIKSQTGDNPLIKFINNAERQNKIHPLLIQDKSKSLTGAFDHFAMEPSRIADDIKKNNPGISQTAELEKQMRANAQARLNDYRARTQQAAENQ